MANGRNKGAQFEREIANMLFFELGITFKRDLRQYQEADHGDLIPDDPAFPFELELKRYAHGPISGTNKWWQQVTTAANKTGKRPALIYRYDRQPIRVRGRVAGHPLQHFIRRFLLPHTGDHGRCLKQN
jgi:Holliday junction resolvase